MTVDERIRSLLYLARYFGTEQPVSFLQDTAAQCLGAGLKAIRPPIQGIYKPKDSPHVSSVWSWSAAGAQEEAYSDSFEQRSDGTGEMQYAPMVGALDVDVNKALFACMQDRVPILAIVTTKPPKTRGGARYRPLGRAIVEAYEPASRLFLLRGCAAAAPDALRPVTASDIEPEEVDVRNGLSLCRRHHWAFDRGLFCVTDSREVRISPAVCRAKREKFDLEEYSGERLCRPLSDSCQPSLEAIDWHRRNVYRAS